MVAPSYQYSSKKFSSVTDVSSDNLEKEIRILKRKLKRCLDHRKYMEDMRDRDQVLYTRLHREVDEARREVEKSHEELQRTQTQLIQQEKMASLGQLTAGIAHEIKNPLNFINNFAEINEELAAELVEAHAENSQARLDSVMETVELIVQNSRVIKEHGKRADSIVHGMMQHASGGTSEKSPTDINALVHEHIDLAYHGKRATLTDFNCALEFDLADDAGEISIVARDIGRVILNLAGNAFDAMHDYAASALPGYEPVLNAATKRSGKQMEIVITDNGPGIPANIKEKIFEPFFTTKATGKGTGLGLSMSYDIITMGHSGSLEVEDPPGGGTRFRIVLPASH